MQNSSSLFQNVYLAPNVWGNWDSGGDEVKHIACCTELDFSICRLNTWYMAGTQDTCGQWMTLVVSVRAPGTERRERALWNGGCSCPVRAERRPEQWRPEEWAGSLTRAAEGKVMGGTGIEAPWIKGAQCVCWEASPLLLGSGQRALRLGSRANLFFFSF